METTLQSYADSLMAELGSWSKQEHKFRELFGNDAIRDRDFQKMKLAEYDRLWQKYQGKAMTTDEKSMLVMLRFQRRKLEKTLYPGILRRIFHRAAVGIKALVANRRQLREQRNQPEQYTYSTITVPGNERSGQKQASEHERQQKGQSHRYGQDLGRRLKSGPDKRQGQSM